LSSPAPAFARFARRLGVLKRFAAKDDAGVAAPSPRANAALQRPRPRSKVAFSCREIELFDSGFFIVFSQSAR